jgi:hypothetical protein
MQNADCGMRSRFRVGLEGLHRTPVTLQADLEPKMRPSLGISHSEFCNRIPKSAI